MNNKINTGGENKRGKDCRREEGKSKKAEKRNLTQGGRAKTEPALSFLKPSQSLQQQLYKNSKKIRDRSKNETRGQEKTLTKGIKQQGDQMLGDCLRLQGRSSNEDRELQSCGEGRNTKSEELSETSDKLCHKKSAETSGQDLDDLDSRKVPI